MHPIFQWLDYRYRDYGGFAKSPTTGSSAVTATGFVAGVNILNGTIDAQQFVNVGGFKGSAHVLAARSRKTIRPMRKTRSISCRTSPSWRERNISMRSATRSVNFSTNGDVNGRSTFSLWSPKVGLLWDVDPTWQVFGNISRSAEVPSFGESVARISSIRTAQPFHSS